MPTSDTHKAAYSEATGPRDFLKRVMWNILPRRFRLLMHEIAVLNFRVRELDAKVIELEKNRLSAISIVGNITDQHALQRRLAAFEDMLPEITEKLAKFD